MNQIQEVTAWLEQALSEVSYDKLELSDEAMDQVELVLAQCRRAKGRVDAPDVELSEDLSSVYIKSSVADVDLVVIRRLAEKLELISIDDLKQEYLTLHEMVVSNSGDLGESIKKMSMVLEKITDFVLSENFDMGARESESETSSGNSSMADGNPKSLVIPDDFRCPISLELMKDPVIASTGQILKEPKFVYTMDMDVKELLDLEPEVRLVEHMPLERVTGDMISIMHDFQWTDEGKVLEGDHSIFSEGSSRFGSRKKTKN